MADDPFRYDGKRVLVVGGATGMGAAAARITASRGAEVVVLDHAPVEFPVAQALHVDLREQTAIDAALQQVTGPIDAVFSAAGVADGTPGLMRINFTAHRHIIEKLLADGTLGRGGAVCMISSGAGMGWESNIPLLTEFAATPDFASAVAWIEAHPAHDNYVFSKQSMNFYTAYQALPLLQRGVRINGILPGPTDTPLARANADLWLGFAQAYRDAAGVPHLSAEQMGNAMAFLNSDAASGISGVTLLVDMGHTSSSIAGSYEADQALLKMMLGRK
jgi:NAD(P)-dependent dehydrogenase (short-subunit alcohol dehydrogenase family)